uniref:p12 n=1 Tax=Japanese iris necrotic ring virus TaxID=77344 RepID=I3XIH0_9TOMB|nr:P12 [Japanese iris necrotic ring virus]
MAGALRRLRGLSLGILRCLRLVMLLVGKLLVVFGHKWPKQSTTRTISISEPLWDNDILIILVLALSFTLIYIFAQQQPIYHHYHTDNNLKTQYITIGTESSKKTEQNGA